METIGDFLRQAGVAVGILFFIVIIYFYIYLPNSTNHGDSVVVPDLTGMPSEQLESFLAEKDLRFEASDSTYSDQFNPLEVIRQFPPAGSEVKPNRKIFVSINRINPPTVLLPAVVEQSLINATAILKSNELKLGEIFYMPSPFSNFVLEMQVNGQKMEIGARVNKGTVVDLIVGDGDGPKDMILESFVGLDLKSALRKLSGYNLHQGDIAIPTDVLDTTGFVCFVVLQKPAAGDSVRVGDPINFWIAPKGYEVIDSLDVEKN